MNEDRKTYVTYRLGRAMHLPRERMGNEIDETTDQRFPDFLRDTQRKLGDISILWMGSKPMPESDEQNENQA